MQHRNERVVIETERYRVTGELMLPSTGYRSRLTDFLASAEQEFIALTDVELQPVGNGAGDAERHPYVAVARRAILIARPLSDTPDA